MFARQLGGTVVEVTRRQKENLLDQEISSALAKPKPSSKTKTPKTRTRPFSRDVRRSIRTAILENVPLNYAARSAVDTARDTADDGEYKAALRALKAGLPATLWVGYGSGGSFVQAAEPVWIADDPQGEDPGQWRQIERDEITSILVENV
jgi:hypothetical protein